MLAESRDHGIPWKKYVLVIYLRLNHVFLHVVVFPKTHVVL